MKSLQLQGSSYPTRLQSVTDIKSRISDGGSSVYTFYGLNLKKPNLSPFRDEATPSFSIFRHHNGDYWFNDFGDDNKGDYITFIQQRESCNFPNALKILKGIYGLIELSGVPNGSLRTLKASEGRKARRSAKNALKKQAKKATVAAVDYSPLSNEDFDYLNKICGGLLSYQIVSTYAYSVKGFTYTNRTPITGLSHVYGFKIDTDSDQPCFKLYMPDQATRPSFWKSLKTAWLGHKGSAPYNLGIEDLALDTPNSPPILLEGEKDFLLAKSLGLNAWTLGGISSSPKAIHPKGLICFDVDAPGRKAALKWLAKGYGAISLPKLSGAKDQNDFADYITTFGFDDDLQAALSKPRFDFGPSPTISVKKYLTENTAGLLHCFSNTPKAILKAPTGSGKTTFLLEHIATAHQGQVYFLCPLTSIVDSLYAKYKDILDIGIVRSGFNDGISIGDAMAHKIVLCTYDSFQKIDIHKDDQALIIADEIHYLSSAYAWKGSSKKAYNYAFKRMVDAKRAIWVSATPPALLDKFGFDKIIIDTTSKTNYSIIRRDFTGKKIHHEIVALATQTDFSKGKIIARFNNRVKIQSLVKHIPDHIKVGILDATRKDDPLYLSVTQDQMIPEAFDLILTTSVIDCGVSILNTDVQAIALFDSGGKTSTGDFLQFVARFRSLDNINVYSYRRHQEKQTELYSDSKYKNVLDYATDKVGVLNQLHLLDKRDPLSRSAPKGKTYNFKEVEDYCYFDGNQWQVSFLSVLNRIEKDHNMYQSPDQFYRKLSTASNIRVLSGEKIEIITIPALDKADQKTKAQIELSRKNTLTLLLEKPEEVFTYYYFRSGDTNLKAAIRKHLLYPPPLVEPFWVEGLATKLDSRGEVFVRRYIDLKRRGIQQSQIPNILADHASSRKWGDLVDTLGHLYNLSALENQTILNPARRLDTISMLTVKDALMPLIGEKLSKDEITALVNQHRPKGLELSKRKAMKLVRILFQVTLTGKYKLVYFKAENTLEDVLANLQIDSCSYLKPEATELNSIINNNSIPSLETPWPVGEEQPF